jgi:hypothetical protein
MSEPEAIRAEVEIMLGLVRERYGSRLSADELDGIRTAIEGIVQAAHALRAVRLTKCAGSAS